MSHLSLDQFLASHPRPTYAPDLGCALMPDGLHLSRMTLRDAKGSEEFRTGKRPTYLVIPLVEFVQPGFPLVFSMALRALRVLPRTVTFDTSALAGLSEDVKAAARRFDRHLRRCLVGLIAYRKTFTIGEEARRCNDSSAAFGFAPRMRRHLLTRIPFECSTCGTWMSLNVDPGTGAPRQSHATCGLCHRSVPVGRLLADRARVRGVHGWLGDISSPRVTVTSPVLPREATCATDDAKVVAKGRKAAPGPSTKGDVPLASPSQAIGLRRPKTRPSTAPAGAYGVARTAPESGRPSPGYRLPDSTHLRLGPVPRITYKDRQAQRSALLDASAYLNTNTAEALYFRNGFRLSEKWLYTLGGRGLHHSAGMPMK